MNARHLLITGKPGVGKTTIIRALADRLSPYRPVGFYTQEIRKDGGRVGFEVITLDGRSRVLSHVEYRGPYRVGRYGVDLEGFEALLEELNLPETRAQVILIDEIGKMECLSQRFCRDVLMVLESPKTVIATVALHGDGLIAEVKRRPDCLLYMLTVRNRDHVLDDLLARVERVLDRDGRQA